MPINNSYTCMSIRCLSIWFVLFTWHKSCVLCSSRHLFSLWPTDVWCDVIATECFACTGDSWWLCCSLLCLPCVGGERKIQQPWPWLLQYRFNPFSWKFQSPTNLRSSLDRIWGSATTVFTWHVPVKHVHVCVFAQRPAYMHMKVNLCILD